MRELDTPESVIEVLHRKYAGAVYDKCRHMLSSQAEAEDAVQETYVRAYKLLLEQRSSRGNSELAWLYRIATYICLHALRSRRQKSETPLSPNGTGGGETQRDDQDRRLDLRRDFERILVELDERGQEIFVAFYLDGIPQGDIADSMGISRRAVVKRLSALRKKIDRFIDE